MNIDYEAARDKLTAELAEIKGSNKYVAAVKKAVCDTLIGFCDQSEAFSEAVCAGGSLADCCAAVVKGVGSSISDLEVYRRAVKFYMPDADVVFEMRITSPVAAEPETKTEDTIIDLMSFL